MKKFKFIFLSAVIALLCFAAIAGAAPKSVTFEYIDYGTNPFTSTPATARDIWSYFDIQNPRPAPIYTTHYWNAQMIGTFIQPDDPTEDLLRPFIPLSYTGDVKVQVHYMTKLGTPTNGSSPIPAVEYTMEEMSHGQAPAFFPDLERAIKASADVMIVVPETGTPMSCDLSPNDKNKIAFTLGTEVSLPASLYAVTFTHTPLPKYAVTATAGEGGTITPASADIEEGASCDFVIAADKGYVIDVLTVDGAAVAAAVGVASYTCTLENVTKALSISASFKKSEEPGKENVSDATVSGDGVTAADPVFVEASDETITPFDAQADNSKELLLVKADGSASDQNVTFKKEAFVCALKLDVTHTDAAAAMTLVFAPADGKSFDTAKKYYAMIENKKTQAYTVFECAHADGKLKATVQPVGDYFSENTVVVYTGTATNVGGDAPSTGGGSGGGCSAGVAALALLALVPFALRRKK